MNTSTSPYAQKPHPWIIESWIGEDGKFGMQDLIDLGKETGFNDPDSVLFGECAARVVQDPEESWERAYEVVESQDGGWKTGFTIWGNMTADAKESLESTRPRLLEIRTENIRLREVPVEV